MFVQLPDIFQSADEFDVWFGKTIGSAGGDVAASLLDEEEKLVITNRLHKVHLPFVTCLSYGHFGCLLGVVCSPDVDSLPCTIAMVPCFHLVAV